MASEIDILIKATDQASGTLDNVKRSLDGIDGSSAGATRGMSGFSGVLAGIGAGASMAALNLIVQAGQAFVGFATSSVTSASDLEESVNKVNIVFGEDAAKEVMSWGESSATTLGQSQQQALEAAGSFGNLFTSMGLTQQASSTMSTDIVELASDLASFNNITPDEALNKLRAGLVGETEPLRTLGVNLNAAAVEMKAMEMTGKTTAAALTDQEKVMARYALIVEQTSNAHGDFARTSDGLANSQRIFDAQMLNLKATLGEAFLPIINKLLIALNDFMPKVIQAAEGIGSFVNAITSLFPQAGGEVDTTGGKINKWFGETFPRASATGNKAYETFRASFEELSKAVTRLMETLGDAIKEVMDNIEEWWGKHGETITRIVDNIFTGLFTIITTQLNLIMDAITLVLQVLTGDWEGAGETLKRMTQTLWDGIKTIFRVTFDNIKLIVGLALDGIKTNFRVTFDNIKLIVGLAWDGIKTIFRVTFDNIKLIVGLALDVIKEDINNKVNAFKELFLLGWQAISDGIGTKFGEMVTAIKTKTTAISTVFSEGMGYWVTLAGEKSSEMATGFVTGLSQLATNVGTKLVEVHTAVINAFVDAHLWLFDIGKSVVQGFINGIGDMIGSAQSKVTELANLAAQAAANALGIQSPSTKFMRLGDQSGEGFLIGLERKFAKVQGMVNSATTGINGGAANSVSNTSNVDFNIYVQGGSNIVQDVRNQIELYRMAYSSYAR